MGLITKEVEIKLSGKIISYYENLGYEIPRYFNKRKGRYLIKQGTTIGVKVEHLMKGSCCLVEVECDECFKRYTIPYNVYIKYNHDGKVYCNHCNSKVFCSGSNAYNYNPNRKEDERFRGSNEYKTFVRSVLARDNYTCQCCGKQSEADMEVHHLYGYAGFPEYRIDQTQSLSLCVNCHKAFHFWHGQHYGYNNKGNCTREQYEKWFGNVVEELNVYDGILTATRKVYCIDNDTIYDSAEDVCLDLGIYGKTQIYNVCNQTRQHVAEGYHFLWYDDYAKMSKQEIDEYVYKCDNPIEYRRIVCLETMEIFDKPNDACLKYGEFKNVPMIIRACKEMRPALKDEFGNKLHWMYYDEYLEKIENGEKIIYHKNQNVKKVICVTTGKIFDKVKDAGLYYDVKPTSISACCKKKIHSAGKTLDGTPLYWMYYDEYSNTEDNIIIPEKKHCKQKIICITTNMVFNSIKEAGIFYGVDTSTITKCCKGKQKTSGKLPDGTKLVWMYYEDFLKLEILERNKDSSTDGSFINYKNNKESEENN